MPIDPVKIPQNVYIEDRIVGPLTLKQTLIMAGGGGFSYALYGMISKASGGISLPVTIMVWIPAVIAAIFALVKINDLSLTRICFLMLERFQKPSTRTWAPRRGISIHIRTQILKEDTEKLEEHKEEVAKVERTREKIKELSSILDHGAEQRAVEMPEAPAMELEDHFDLSDDKPTFKRPVSPDRISVDHPEGEAPKDGMSDLSVFRDIFPPQN